MEMRKGPSGVSNYNSESMENDKKCEPKCGN